MICSGGNLVLEANSNNALSYLWSQGSTNAQINISSGGSYSVTVENTCGQAFASTIINEMDCDTSCAFLIPNAFTPNGDGTNDNWYIQCIELYPDNEVEIYNRWGQLVYKKSNYTGDWDGNYQGSPLPDAAYFYILKIKFPPPIGERVYTASVSIIR
jgi:gliding motility-associated-like protein